MIIGGLPNDNIYKFMAFSGLALLLFAFTYPQKLADEAQFKIAEVQTVADLMQIENDELEERMNRWKSLPLPEKKADLVALTAANKAFKIRNTKLEGELRKIRLLNKKFEEAIYLGLGTLIMGFALTLMGFYFWYYRIQKPADEMALQGFKRGKDAEAIHGDEHA